MSIQLTRAGNVRKSDKLRIYDLFEVRNTRELRKVMETNVDRRVMFSVAAQTYNEMMYNPDYLARRNREARHNRERAQQQRKLFDFTSKRAAKKIGNALKDWTQTERTYKTTVNVERLYKKDFYKNRTLETRTGSTDTLTFVEILNTTPSQVKKYLERYNNETSVFVDTVINYRLERSLTLTIKEERKHKMRRAFIVKNDWFRYLEGVADYAYKNNENKCVYYQLSQFLLNPPTGIPQKRIGKQKMSPEAIYDFLAENYGRYYDDEEFNMDSGVSTEMIERICHELKRNMYAYNAENKVFSCIKSYSSKNYCPIVFYKYAGHFYILDKPDSIRSVAESNKANSTSVISNLVENAEKELLKLPVYHLETFDVDNAYQYAPGIYLMNQSNLNYEMRQFYITHRHDIYTKSQGNVVVQMKYKNENNEDVFIACDMTYGLFPTDETNIHAVYDMIKNVASKNGIDYINEGIGGFIGKLLNKMRNEDKVSRERLDKKILEKLVKECKGKCNMCGLKFGNDYEIDHIEPIASGGTNDITNLQCLCISCHREKTTGEHNNSKYRMHEKAESVFNEFVRKHVIETPHFKSLQFVENVNEDIYSKSNENELDEFDYERKGAKPKCENNLSKYFNIKTHANKTTTKKPTNNGIQKADMTKCRRNLLLNYKYKFPVYSVMDGAKPFSGTIQCGFYYIETENYYPMRGCGWYGESTTKYCLENELIVLENIKLESISSESVDNTYFKKHVNYLMKAFETEPKLQKLAVNSFIGTMGKTKQHAAFTKYTNDPFEASLWLEKHENCSLHISSTEIDDDFQLYEGIFSRPVVCETTLLPIYKLIIEEEAIELHKLETLIKKQGGIILDRNTDAIRFYCEKELNITGSWDNEKTVSKYQKEEPKPLTHPHIKPFMREPLDTTLFDLQWNIKYDYDNIDERINEILDSKKSIHIDGRAGTGKTYLINHIKKELDERGLKHLGFSPTNRGARLIDGKTIHSLYFKYRLSKSKMGKMLDDVKYIFIDEVSMMQSMFYQLFMMIRTMFPNILYIVSGDMGQLLPVKDEWDGDYDTSCGLYSLTDGNKLILTKCRRSDDDLYNLCRNIESIDIERFTPNEDTYLNIAYTHKTRMMVNEKCMRRFLNGRRGVKLPRHEDNIKTQDVELIEGMPVIAHITDKKKTILNMDMFQIKSITDEEIILKDEEREVTIATRDFHKYFYIGFCITVYASQGATFNEKYTIWDWDHPNMCDRAKYVALSRATDIDNIQINK
jgi:hypothetical protein